MRVLLALMLLASYSASTPSALSGELSDSSESISLFEGLPPESPESILRWSPGGGQIAFAGLKFGVEEESFWECDVNSCLGLAIVDLQVKSVTILSGEADDFVWGPDAKWLIQPLLLGPLGTMRFCRIDRDSGLIEPVLTVPYPIVSCSFALDSQRVAYLLDNELYVANLIKGEANSQKILVEACPSPTAVLWMGTSERLLLLDTDGLYLYDLRNKKCHPVPPPSGEDWESMQERYVGVSATGKEIAVIVYPDATLYILTEVTNGWRSRRVATTGGKELIAHPLFSADQRMIAFVRSGLGGEGKYTLWVTSTKGGEAIKVADDYQRAWARRGFDWSPDGKRLAYVSTDNSIKLVEITR